MYVDGKLQLRQRFFQQFSFLSSCTCIVQLKTTCFLFKELFAGLSLTKYFLFQMKGAKCEEDIKRWLEYTEDRPYNDHRYPMDSSKLKKLGWSPKINWDEGIERTSKFLFLRCAYSIQLAPDNSS